MAKTTKTTKSTKTAKAKKPVAKAAPAAKKTATAVKVTVKGKTTVKVAPHKAQASKVQTKATAQKSAPVAKAAPAKAVAAPVKTVAAPVVAKVVAKPVAPVQIKSSLPLGKPAVSKAPAPVAAPVVPKKPEKLDFGPGDFVVYPAHGVGYVEGVETQVIAGMEITLYTISFEKDRMRLKLPVSKVKASGLRKLSSKDRLKDALSTLQGKSQVRRIMWSRRAQEYEMKINSGDPVAIAEVLRDLKREGDQGEQSYSERQIYQAALERLAREVAAIEKIDEKKAAEKLEAVLGNVA